MQVKKTRGVVSVFRTQLAYHGSILNL